MIDSPAGWSETTVGRVCVAVGTHDPRDRPTERFRYIDIRGVDGDLHKLREVKEILGAEAPSRARQLVRVHDTVLSTVRTYQGKTAVVPPDLDGATASTGFCILRPSDVVEPKYMFYWVTSPRFIAELSTKQTGSSYPAVREKDVLGMPLLLPPLDEQRRIVEVIEEQFSRLDAAEASLNHAQQKLDSLRQYCFRLTKSMEATPQRVTDVARIVSGQTPKGLLADSAGEVPFYKVGDMNSAVRYLMGVARTYVSVDTARDLKLHIWPSGTVIFPKRGGAIATNKKRVLGSPAAFDLNTMGLVPSESLSSKFLLFWLETIDLARLSDGSNVPQINHGDIAELEISVPSVDDQHRIVEEIERLLSITDGARLELQRARQRSRQLRRAILEYAFCGGLVPPTAGDPVLTGPAVNQRTKGEAQGSR